MMIYVGLLTKTKSMFVKIVDNAILTKLYFRTIYIDKKPTSRLDLHASAYIPKMKNGTSLK
jgi:hypothetical protein